MDTNVLTESTNTFFECLVEAYRKKVEGRTEFKVGKKTTVIVNPTHMDITKFYGSTQKPKTTRML